MPLHIVETFGVAMAGFDVDKCGVAVKKDEKRTVRLKQFTSKK